MAKMMGIYNRLLMLHQSDQKLIEQQAESKKQIQHEKKIADDAKIAAKKAVEQSEVAKIAAKKAQEQVAHERKIAEDAKIAAKKAAEQAARDRIEIERLNREKLITNLTHQFITTNISIKTRGYIYIASSKPSFIANDNKVGSCIDLDKRLAGYNTGRAGNNLMEYLAFWEVPIVEAFEPLAFAMLQPWRVVENTPGARGLGADSNAEVIHLPFKSLKRILDLVMTRNWRDAMNEANRCIESDVLIQDALEHIEDTKDYDSTSQNQTLPTFKPVYTPKRLLKNAEKIRMAAIPNFTTQPLRALPTSHDSLKLLALDYCNRIYRPTPAVTNQKPTPTRAKYIIPVVEFRKWLEFKKLAHLPTNVSIFKEFAIDVFKNHEQLNFTKNKPSGWTAPNPIE